MRLGPEAGGAANSSVVEPRWLTLFSAGKNRREQKCEVLSRVQRGALRQKSSVNICADNHWWSLTCWQESYVHRQKPEQMTHDKLIAHPEVTLSLTVVLFLFCSPVIKSLALFILTGGANKLVSAENEFGVFSSSRQQSRGRKARIASTSC